MQNGLSAELYSTILRCPRLAPNAKVGEEQRLSILVANMLRACSLEGELNAVFFAVPNEGKRNYTTGAKHRAMGLIPGAPDLMVVGKDKSVCIELKLPKKSSQLSPSQNLFKKWAEHMGIRYTVCRSVDEVEEVLEEEGLLVKEQ